MRFLYPALLQRTGVDEIVVSFRDLPECLTSGVDEAEALAEAQDALEEAIADGLTTGSLSRPRARGKLVSTMSWCLLTWRRRPPWPWFSVSVV